MNKTNNSIISGLQYKIKKGKDVNEIYDYLLKQSKRNKIFSIILIIIWAIYILSYFIFGKEKSTSYSTFDSIITFLQIIILPLISILLFKLNKKYILTKEEIKAELENRKDNIN